MLFATAEELERKKRAQATGVVDNRTPQQAVESLVTPPSALVMPRAPMSPSRQANERYGTGETILRRMGNLLTGGLFDEQIIPEMSDGNRLHYKNAMELYQEDVAAMHERAQRQSRMTMNRDTVMDGIETPGDFLARAELVADTGSVANADYALGREPYQAPRYETKYDNGILTRYNVNDPSDVMIVKDPNGNPITEKADADTKKTAGWFRRAVPALENMHKLEDRGVTLPREALLLIQQAQDADGFLDMQVYNQLLNNLEGGVGLSKDQKQYLRNAQDLAMIQLRKESGAAIGVQEMFNELNQNVMLNDMSDEGYSYQRSARSNKYRQLSAEMPQPLLDAFKKEGLFTTMDRLRSGSARHYDVSGERTDFSNVSSERFEDVWKQLPPGQYTGPGGKVVIKKPPPRSNVFGTKK